MREAQEIALQILDFRARALSVVVEAMVRVSDYQAGLELFCQIEDNYWRTETLVGIVRALAITSNHEEAQNIAQNIGDSYGRVRALSYVAHILEKAGEIERSSCLLREAQEVARTIENRHTKEKALIVVAQVLAWTGKYEEAQNIAQDMVDPYSRADILKEIVSTLARAGEYEEAQEIARTIEVWKVLIWEGIAQVLVTDEKALRWVQQVWRQANTREHTLEILPLAYPFIPLKPEIGVAFAESFDWVDSFLKGA